MTCKYKLIKADICKHRITVTACVDRVTHKNMEYLGRRQPLISVIAADSRVAVLLPLLLHVLHTADKLHRLHT